MIGRVSEPEMPWPASGTCAKSAKTPPSAAFRDGRSAAGQAGAGDRRGGGQAIVGAVPRPSHGASPENQDQPYGTEDERAGEPAADTPVRREEAGRLAVPEAESQKADTPSAARRRTPQRRTPG